MTAFSALLLRDMRLAVRFRLELVSVRCRCRDGADGVRGRHRLGFDEPVRQHEVGCVVAEIGAQARGPADVLAQRAREPRVPAFRELDLDVVTRPNL